MASPSSSGRRIGHRGQSIQVLKFRTMRVGPAASAANARSAAMAGDLDPRTTRVGAVLRRTRIDELPQVWNILRPEMS